jgi:hypothetical protein
MLGGHSQAQVLGLQNSPPWQPPQSSGQTQAQLAGSAICGDGHASFAGSQTQAQLTRSSFSFAPQGWVGSHWQVQDADSQAHPETQPPQSDRQAQLQVAALATSLGPQ